MAEKEREDGRQSGEFTEEEGRVHRAGFKIIHEGLQKGLTFTDACAGLEVVDPGMRLIIIDDYLKVAIAEEHFQGEKPLEEVAEGLKAPLEEVERARQEMLGEVQQAAADYYRRDGGATDFEVTDFPQGNNGKRDN